MVFSFGTHEIQALWIYWALVQMLIWSAGNFTHKRQAIKSKFLIEIWQKG